MPVLSNESNVDMMVVMGKSSKSCTTATIASAPGLPDPQEVYAFLTKRVRLRCLNPDEPVSLWPGRAITALPFSDELVEDLRALYRAELRRLNEKDTVTSRVLRVLREGMLDGSSPRNSPPSADLFYIAGAYAPRGERLRHCLDMAGLTQGQVEIATGATKLNEFLNGDDDGTYGHLGCICEFLNINPEWIEKGPKSYVHLKDKKSPWWLDPWRLACQEALHVFKAAFVHGLLPWRQQQDPAGFDFLTFWANWQRFNKANIRLPVGDRDGAPSGDQEVGSFLPWMFCCWESFRSGDDSFPVRFTEDTWDILQRMINSYVLDGPPQPKQSELVKWTRTTDPPIIPAAEPPPRQRLTMEEILHLQKWLHAPPGDNPTLKLPNGTVISVLPTRIPLSSEVPSRRGKGKPGPKKGTKRKAGNKEAVAPPQE